MNTLRHLLRTVGNIKQKYVLFSWQDMSSIWQHCFWHYIGKIRVNDWV